MKFPDIGLLNRFYLGDSVLLEPMADTLAEQGGSDVYVISRYPELFENHPRVVGLPSEGPFPPRMRTIDMSDAISSMKMVEIKGKQRIEFIPGKYERLWKAAGLSKLDGRSPKLYLSPEESAKAAELRALFGEKRVGLILRSNMPVKVWPYMKQLMKALIKSGHDVFAISDTLTKDDSYVLDSGAYRVVGKSLRELMVYLSIMNAVAGGDTGPTHIAAALGIPTVAITREFWTDLFPYHNCRVLGTKHMTVRGLHAIGPKKVFNALAEVMGSGARTKRVRRIAGDETVGLFRLDGLGGSITLTDHAKKIYEMTGKKSTAIVRGYGVAFKDNPYIRDVVEVGYVKWAECVAEMKERYSILAEIRFAPAKWHQSNGKLFEQDFENAQGLFDVFPANYRDLEIHGLHHVQLTDKYLGLPYDSIDMQVYYLEDVPYNLPDEYIVVTNGVDIQHGSMRQTKVWNKWAELVRLSPLPVVQAGTTHDPPIRGVIDLRGRTTVAQFFSLLKNARATVCTEGGTMHAAYAVKANNVLVLRGPTRGRLFEYPGHRFIDSYLCQNCWSITDDWYARCPKWVDSICMESISAERVAYNLEEALNEGMA